MFQRMIAGRIDGYTSTGSSFLWRAAQLFGIWVEGAGLPPHTDGLAIHYPDRPHIAAEDLLADMRRFYTPLDSFSGFMGDIHVVYYGPGFIQTVSAQEGVLAVAESYLSALRTPAELSAWAILECPSVILNRDTGVFNSGCY